MIVFKPDFETKICIMWYEKLGIISIGAQSGGSDDGGLGELKIDLWKLLLQHCRESHCPNISHYALALRIGGEFGDFGEEGVAMVRRNKKERFISAEIIIPKSVWQPKTPNQLRDYLAVEMRNALRKCVTRLQKDKEQVNEIRLLRDIDAAVEEFKKIDYN